MSGDTYEVDFSKLPQPILTDHPEWVDLYNFAWRTAAGHIRRSRGRWHMDVAWDPARNYQWVWDTCFMTLYCRYAADQFPGMASLDNFYELQRDDGYISMTYDLNTGAEPYPKRINPPLFAWVEWEYYLATGDASRLARAAGHIARLTGWIDRRRRTSPHRRRCTFGRGEDEREDLAVPLYRLYYFKDCGSSGMDDSPRTPRKPGAGRFFDWIDLSSQMVLTFRALAAMHETLGNTAEATRWNSRAEETGKLINSELWCERTAFYHDRSLPANFVAHKTAAGFWPILAGICPEERLDALVGHLENEREFNRPTPVPTLSADDANYSPEGVYWLGGVWAPTNYMITRGLMHAGRGDTAHAIALKYLGALARTYAAVEPHTLWESNAPESDRPGLRPYSRHRVKPDFVGWTGLGPIAMLIENIIGLDLDLPRKRVTWTIRLMGEHGIERLGVGPGKTADFRCAARTNADAPAEVELRSDVDLTVELARSRERREIRVRSGEQAVRVQV